MSDRKSRIDYMTPGLSEAVTNILKTLIITRPWNLVLQRKYVGKSASMLNAESDDDLKHKRLFRLGVLHC
jgi:hypothetical protein